MVQSSLVNCSSLRWLPPSGEKSPAFGILLKQRELLGILSVFPCGLSCGMQLETEEKPCGCEAEVMVEACAANETMQADSYAKFLLWARPGRRVSRTILDTNYVWVLQR